MENNTNEERLDTIQKISDYKLGDIVGIIVPDRGNVNTISGEIIAITDTSFTIQERPFNLIRGNTTVTQDDLTNEKVVVSKYN